MNITLNYLARRMLAPIRRWDRRHVWGRDMIDPSVDRCLVCPAIRQHRP